MAIQHVYARVDRLMIPLVRDGGEAHKGMSIGI